MSSFAKKLGRLPPLAPATAGPSLDELRARIETILGAAAAAPVPAVSPDGVSPDGVSPDGVAEAFEGFGEETNDVGVVFARHRVTPPGHRVGHAPLWGARRADASMVALFALDPALAEVDFSRALYVDTETTGLMGGTATVPFLLGLAFERASGEGVVVEQILLRKYADEPAMIERLRARLEQASVIVTYNGKSFDLPLLEQRAVMNRLPPLPRRPHLDLLHLARRIHGHRLSSCSLAQIESHVLGRVRVGDVGGAEIAAIYQHYARSGDAFALAPVLEHNELDVLSMVALVGLYGEPLEGWARASEIAAASWVAQRGGDGARAAALAEASIARGAGAFGHRIAGDVARARGDKAAALRAYEAALAEGCAGEADALPVALPKVRLELAKLYEHHAKAYEKALLVLAESTVEQPHQHEKRVARVARKLVKKSERKLPGRPRRPGAAQRGTGASQAPVDASAAAVVGPAKLK